MSKPKRGAAARRMNIRGLVKASVPGLMTKVEPIKKPNMVSGKARPRPGV